VFAIAHVLCPKLQTLINWPKQNKNSLLRFCKQHEKIVVHPFEEMKKNKKLSTGAQTDVSGLIF